MKKERVIGILGGLGPDATTKLCSEITALTPATKDQDHIKVITFSNPKIPDRTNYILGKGKSPVREMVRTARTLQHAGADFLVIPCNTAHYFYDYVQRSVDVPIINMIEETAKFIHRKYPHVEKVGLLATTGTVATGLYERALARYGIEVFKPTTEEQEGLVMEAIYGEKGIKAGTFEYPKLLLENAAFNLLDRGAQLIISGCTEIGIVFNKPKFLVVDPSNILAKVAVEKATMKRSKAEDFLFEVIVEPYMFIKKTATEPLYYIKDKAFDLLNI